MAAHQIYHYFLILVMFFVSFVLLPGGIIQQVLGDSDSKSSHHSHHHVIFKQFSKIIRSYGSETDISKSSNILLSKLKKKLIFRN